MSQKKDVAQHIGVIITMEVETWNLVLFKRKDQWPDISLKSEKIRGSVIRVLPIGKEHCG
jgi:hypothetical protein